MLNGVTPFWEAKERRWNINLAALEFDLFVCVVEFFPDQTAETGVNGSVCRVHLEIQMHRVVREPADEGWRVHFTLSFHNLGAKLLVAGCLVAELAAVGKH